MDKINLVSKALLIFSALSLVGCGSLLGKKDARVDDYRKATTGAVITTPDGVHQPDFKPLFPVPAVSENARALADGKFVLAPPVPLPVVWDEERIKLASNKQKTWLAINVAPSFAWASVSEFWREQGVALTHENARKGIMETEWVVLDERLVKVFGRGKAEASSRVKMQILIERGDFPDMTNIYLTQYYHDGSVSELPESASIDWSVPERFDHVKAPLEELLGYLKANQKAPSSISLVAQSTSLEQRSEIVQRSGLNMLLLRKDFNHSWVSVGDALRLGKFPLEDLDRSQSIFYLELRDSEKNKSELLEEMLQNELLSKKLLGDYKLQLKLVEEDNNILVRVEDSQGRPAVNAVSVVILKRLKEYIS